MGFRKQLQVILPDWPRQGGMPTGVRMPGGTMTYQANRVLIASYMGLNAAQAIARATDRPRRAKREQHAFDTAALNFSGRGGHDLYEAMTEAAVRYMSAATGLRLDRGSAESDWYGLPAGPGDVHPPEQQPEMYADHGREIRRDTAREAAATCPMRTRTVS